MSLLRLVKSIEISDLDLRGLEKQCHCNTSLQQGLHRPRKVLSLDFGPGKLLEFENSAICPGIVLEFCKSP